MSENKFYICEHCGNIIGLIHDAGVPIMCCGQKMTKIEPNVVDASEEKHLPVVVADENAVNVVIGSVAHPMAEEHHISWVYLQTDKGGHRRCLKAGDEPTVKFAITDEKPLAVYAYCNLHGLWKTEIEEEKVCPLKPIDPTLNENYVVCKCNNVSYFDILDAIKNNENINKLLDMFDAVKNTTKCSTGCGGCYEKVIKIISYVLENGEKF